MRIPKKVKPEKECPLGKLNPLTEWSKGSNGRGLLNKYFNEYNAAVLLKPMKRMGK